MPSITENLKLWGEFHTWERAGEEWCVGYADGATGNAEIAWSVGIWPRIHKFLPAKNILEIAPGYGAWTHYLRQFSRRLTIVDLVPRCIEACRRRFGPVGMTYHVNDGRSLAMIPDGSIDFVFSWHSLVHCQHDVMREYTLQLGKKLRHGGVGMIQHSNLGEFLDPATGTHSIPNPAGFGEDMTADKFAADAADAGLAMLSQEICPWGYEHAISCFSLFKRPAPGEVVPAMPSPWRNDEFWDEVRHRFRVEQAYGRPPGVTAPRRPASLLGRAIVKARRRAGLAG